MNSEKRLISEVSSDTSQSREQVLIHSLYENDEEQIEHDENKDIDVDTLYGDLDNSMEPDDTETPSAEMSFEKSSFDNRDSLIILHNIDLDESTNSVDSNELVIDLDNSSDDVHVEEQKELKVEPKVKSIVGQILESLIDSIEDTSEK